MAEPVLHRGDLGQELSAEGADPLARLARDRDAEAAQPVLEHADIGVQVERPLAGMVGDAQPAAGVDLGDRAAESDEMLDHAGHHGRRMVEGGQVFIEHPVGHVEVDGVYAEAAARATSTARSRSSA